MPYVARIHDEFAFLGFNAEMSKTPFVIVGVPMDETSSYRVGARWGPTSIRRVSRSLELCSILTGLDMESVGFYDAGDVVPDVGSSKGTLAKTRSVVEELLRLGKRVFVLGGDHLITYGAYVAFSSFFNDHCLIVFDAHLDLRDVFLGSRFNHATVMRRIIEDAKPRTVLYIGVRAVSAEEKRYARKLEEEGLIRIVWSKELLRNPLSCIEEAKRNMENCAALYVSIDMDVFDPAYAPAVQTPEPLGITPREFFEIISAIIDKRVHIVDVVEVAPDYDVGEATSALAARIVIEIAALLARDLGVGEVC